MNGWADLDDAVLRALADGTPLPDVDIQHVRVAVRQNVAAGRLEPVRDAVRTVYRVTPAGRAHLQQMPTLVKVA